MAKSYYSRGWLPATAGNLSIRDQNNRSIIWITTSGLNKGRIEPTDFIPIDLETDLPIFLGSNQKPSAETSIHLTIYKNIPQVNCILHVHTVESMRCHLNLNKNQPIGFWKLPPIELIKAFGIWDENPEVYLPIIYNHSMVENIASDLNQYFLSDNWKNMKQAIPAILVENHGPTIWGESIEAANKHLEALDYIFKVSIYYDK
ncbi:methylthioribulose 1-phosphate dehydratase [Leptospira sp. GIMC2001]|uniref:methylthioribulose 1-phosphate dehydratase n=1 Tax=Leptospira sp. GIMC2001 TaxID=1513297 RepID=UPI00234976BC|nr:methylthioribulose 1-phosphate dehydratase [Leptospira sp. GIMC2001]WCL47580.1 methylthioribulose 1-phosphate dehydratase [Leptospira sp. GIMC2001]